MILAAVPGAANDLGSAVVEGLPGAAVINNLLEKEMNVMANQLKQRWASGKAALNGWINIPAGFSAEVMAKCGFHSVTVDLQHAPQDCVSMVQCFQAMQAHPITPLARVPWLEPGIVGKVLDNGAMGVICPMVNNRQSAEALVQYAKYPLRGARSFGPIRASIYGGGSSYHRTANEETLVLPMIETQEAVENLDEILDVKGIAGIYVGPADLAFSYGKEPEVDHEEEFFLDIYAKLIAACNKRGLCAGIHAGSGAYAARMVKMGFRLVTIATDTSLLEMAATTEIAAAKSGSGGIA